MKHFIKEKLQSNLMRKMIFCYVILLLIPGVVAGFLYYAMIRNYLYKEKINLEQSTITQYCKDIDQNLSSVDDVYYLIQQHNNFIRFLNFEYKSKVDQIQMYMSEFWTMFSYASQYSPNINDIKIYMLKDGLLEMGESLQKIDKLENQTIDHGTIYGCWRYDLESNQVIYRKALRNRSMNTELAILEISCNADIITDILNTFHNDYNVNVIISYENQNYIVRKNALQPYNEVLSGNPIVMKEMKKIPMRVMVYLDKSTVVKVDNRLVLMAILILAAIILLSLIYFTFVFHYSKRIADFSRHIANSYSIVPDKYNDRSKDDIGKMIHNFNTMIENNDNLLNLVRIEQIRQNETAYKVLQMQIDPHFIYNSLEGIRMFAEMRNETDISDIIYSMSILMRYTFTADTNQVKLENEIDYVDQYLKVQKMRLGAKLTFDISYDTSIGHLKCPKFIVQPMIENAIKYGLDSSVASIHIQINLIMENDFVYISIEDNGRGMDDCVRSDMNNKLQQGLSLSQYASGNGIGLENVNGRMRFLHPDSFSMILNKTESEHGLCVIMKWKPEE